MMKTERHFGDRHERGGGRALRIGEVAKRTGIGVETLRFYERRGLLGRPRRTESNYRLYDEAVLEQVTFIKRAQALGFTLDEIGEILAESTQGRLPCHHVREMTRRKLAELDRRLEELQRYRDELASALDHWDERGQQEGTVCGLIEHSTVNAPDASHEDWQRAKRGKHE